MQCLSNEIYKFCIINIQNMIEIQCKPDELTNVIETNAEKFKF